MPLEIRTDSSYVTKAMTEWVPNWQRKDWAVPVENKDLFQYHALFLYLKRDSLMLPFLAFFSR